MGILGLVMVYSSTTHGQRSCLSEHTALQTVEVIQPGVSHKFRYPLIAQRANESFETKVYFEGTVDQQDPTILRFSVAFDPSFSGVSIPYTVQALLILRDGDVIGWWDFTRLCKGPGISFFPGRVIQMPVVKLIGGKSQTLQIMVWGRL